MKIDGLLTQPSIVFKKNFGDDINQLRRQGTTFSSNSTIRTNTDASPKGKRNVRNKSNKGSNKMYSSPTKRLSLTTSTSHPTFPTTNQSNRGSGSFFKDTEQTTLTKPRTISTTPQQQRDHQSFSSSSDGSSSPGSTGNWPSIFTHTKSSTNFSLPNLIEDPHQQNQSHSNEKDKRPSLLFNKNSDGDYFTNSSDSNQSRRSRPSSGEPSSKTRPMSLKFDQSVDGSPTKKGLHRNLRMSLRKATRRSTFSSGSVNQ